MVVYLARAWFDYPTPPAGFSFSPGTAICKSAETCFRLSRNLDVALGEESVSVAPGGFADTGGHRVTLGSFADNSNFAQCVSDSSAFDLFVAIVPTGS